MKIINISDNKIFIDNTIWDYIKKLEL
jgi:hypothetical protein